MLTKQLRQLIIKMRGVLICTDLIVTTPRAAIPPF